jgi:pilus assembly protein CpaC
VINTTERLKRVSVTDDSVADAIVVTPTQILVHGRSAGEVSLLIWDELERSRSFDLRVDVDVTAAAEEERRVFPDEQINVSPRARPSCFPATSPPKMFPSGPE